MADKELQEWLDSHKDEFKLLDNGKVHCKVSKHDIPQRLADLQQHWSGRVYRRAQVQNKLNSGATGIDFSKYSPHFVPHKSDATKVYCKVTRYMLHNDEDEVQAHIRGRKYAFGINFFKAPKKYEVADKKGAEEEEDDIWSRAPNLDSDVEEEEEEEDAVEEAAELGSTGKVVPKAQKEEDEGEQEEDAAVEEEKEVPVVVAAPKKKVMMKKKLVKKKVVKSSKAAPTAKAPATATNKVTRTVSEKKVVKGKKASGKKPQVKQAPATATNAIITTTTTTTTKPATKRKKSSGKKPLKKKVKTQA